jgi:hypothetical protein
VSFPCTSVVMDCQKEKCEHHLVDFVLVIFHGLRLAIISLSFNPGSKMETRIKSLQANRGSALNLSRSRWLKRSPVLRARALGVLRYEGFRNCTIRWFLESASGHRLVITRVNPTRAFVEFFGPGGEPVHRP